MLIGEVTCRPSDDDVGSCSYLWTAWSYLS